MAAQALNCPNCGAAAAAGATRCEHCDSRLATVACPSCFGMIFRGARFCSHCGAAVSRVVADDDQKRPCPRCRVNTQAVELGQSRLRECPRCEGLWADADTLQQIYTNREAQSAVLGAAQPIPETPAGRLEPVRYLPCPMCRKLMNRVNFANCSAVIVDVCKPHGTWFDKDELRRIVEFIRAGGFEKARAKEIAELDRQRRQLESARTRAARDGAHTGLYSTPRCGLFESALGAAVDSVMDSLLH